MARIAAQSRLTFIALAIGLLAGCTSRPTPETKRPADANFNVSICVRDECGIVDQNASVLLPFAKKADLVDIPMQDTMLLSDGKGWRLVDQKSRKEIKRVGTEIYDASPNYFGFKRDGKIGLMDLKGTEIQAPRFDVIYPGGNDQYIGFNIGGKRGILKSDGTLLVDAEFDSSEILGDLSRSGGWITAEKDHENWLVNYKTGAKKKVPYDRLGDAADGLVVASNIREEGENLLDMQGHTVLPKPFAWLGTPSSGLIAFRDKKDDPCGYLDYTGKVVIAAQFAKCAAFGKRAALVQVQNDSSDDPEFVVIDRAGKQIKKTAYSAAIDSKFTVMGNSGDIPGLTAVATSTGTFAHQYGLFDVDEARELVAPSYAIMGAITPNLIVYAKEERLAEAVTSDESFETNPLAEASLVGLMDRTGKVLVEPSKYIRFEVDGSGKYIRAMNLKGEALLDMNGKTLIESEWDKLVIDEAKGAIFAYDVERPSFGVENKYLKAAYDLNGKTLFSILRSACGAEQLMNGVGVAVWPKGGAPACPSASKKT